MRAARTRARAHLANGPVELQNVWRLAIALPLLVQGADERGARDRCGRGEVKKRKRERDLAHADGNSRATRGFAGTYTASGQHAKSRETLFDAASGRHPTCQTSDQPHAPRRG